MPQKLSNAARALLTGAIITTDTSLSIEAAKADLFPVANTGTSGVNTSGLDWFKAVLQDSSGNIEIVYVRTRASASAVLSNVIRAQEGTTARAFAAGSVIGLRITALDIEGRAASGPLASSGITGAAASGANTDITSITGNAATATIAAACSGNAATASHIAGGSGGTIPYQSAAGATAMLANGGAGQVLQSNGGTSAPGWATVDLGGKVSKSGDTMSGNLTITNTGPTLVLSDTDNGVTKQVHHNSDLIGFLGNQGQWIQYNNNSGQMWTPNYGWLHDRFAAKSAEAALDRINAVTTNNCYGTTGNTDTLTKSGNTLVVQRNCNCNCDCNCSC